MITKAADVLKRKYLSENIFQKISLLMQGRRLPKFHNPRNIYWVLIGNNYKFITLSPTTRGGATDKVKLIWTESDFFFALFN
jgi:hypothetical protein